MSEKNRAIIIPIYPSRGKIYSKEGSIIADNKTHFQLCIDSRYKSDLKILSEKIKKEIKLKKRGLNKFDITWEQLTSFEENKRFFPNIYIEYGIQRYYPFKGFGHIAGYLTSKNNNKIGKTGIEEYYEYLLSGYMGHKKMEVNAQGFYVRIIEEKESISGKDLHLDIDSSLQEKIFESLGSDNGAVGVMDNFSGKLISLISKPDIPSNDLSFGIKYQNWQNILHSPDKPMTNRFLSHYSPGSTFKIITLLAALEKGIPASYKVFCSGSTIVGNHTFHCWNKNGHGALDMENAIKHSCNSYLFQIAKLIGAESIFDMSKKLGLNTKSGIDLYGEYDPAKLPLMQRFFGKKWSLGDTLNICIGQGYMQVNILQMLRMTCAIATGRLINPHLYKQTVGSKMLNLRSVEIIKNGMNKAVNEIGGTAYSSMLKSFPFAGKTGTAQVASKRGQDLNSKNISKKLRNHAWFIGYGPIYDPQFSCCIFVENGGGGGSVAAPIAKTIFEHLRHLKN